MKAIRPGRGGHRQLRRPRHAGRRQRTACFTRPSRPAVAFTRFSWSTGSRMRPENIRATGKGQEIRGRTCPQGCHRLGGGRVWWTSRAIGRVGRWFSSRRAITRSSAWAARPGCGCRPETEQHPYELTSYAELYAVKVDGSGEKAPFFDMDAGGKVRGAERERRSFSCRSSAWTPPASRAPTIKSRCTSTRAPGAIRPFTPNTCACRPARFDSLLAVSCKLPNRKWPNLGGSL